MFSFPWGQAGVRVWGWGSAQNNKGSRMSGRGVWPLHFGNVLWILAIVKAQGVNLNMCT